MIWHQGAFFAPVARPHKAFDLTCPHQVRSIPARAKGPEYPDGNSPPVVTAGGFFTRSQRALLWGGATFGLVLEKPTVLFMDALRMQRHVKHVRQLLASVGRYRERDKLLLRLTHSNSGSDAF